MFTHLNVVTVTCLAFLLVWLIIVFCLFDSLIINLFLFVSCLFGWPGLWLSCLSVKRFVFVVAFVSLFVWLTVV